MAYLPLLNEGELNELVSYSLDENEEMVEAVVNAFHAANIDVVEKPTLHSDGFNGDVLEEYSGHQIARCIFALRYGIIKWSSLRKRCESIPPRRSFDP